MRVPLELKKRMSLWVKIYIKKRLSSNGMNLFTKKKSDIPARRQVDYDVRPQAQPATSNIFRRNRTLTGTTSNNMGSAGIRSDLESSRTHAHNLTNHRRKILGVLAIVLVSSAFLWTLISNFTAAVAVSVPSAVISKSIDKSRYEKIIQEYLDINPMGRFHFMLDQSALSTFVSEKMPEVSSVVQKSMLSIGQTDFAITMRTPIAGWKIGSKQYYVDSKGISFEQNYFASPTVQIIDNSGASPTTGAAVVSNRLLSFVGRVVAEAKTSGYIVTQAILPPNTTRELDIKFKGSNSYIKLSIDRPAGEQIEDMDRAVKYLAGRGFSPGYIDVRVSGKAFYK